MNRKLRAVPDGHGYAIVDQADGKTVDWINGPRAGHFHEGDTDSYVIIGERPSEWPEDMRWMVTRGQRVRQTGGIREGRTGTIIGQARSRKADRLFSRAIEKSSIVDRDLTDEDFEMLIDDEGPLIRFDDADGVGWFPGQSFCFEPIA